MGVEGPKTGFNMKLYRNTGTIASPTWTECTGVGDVSISDFSRGLAELKRRGNQFTKNLGALIQSIAVEVRLEHGINVTLLDALRTAFLAGTVEEYAIMDNTITVEDSQGLRVPLIIEQFPWDQPLEEVSGHDIRLAVGYMEEASAEVDPAWYVVPGA